MPAGVVPAADEQRRHFFSRADGQLGVHPITDGRETPERIDRVATFIGQAFRASEEYTALLTFGKGAEQFVSLESSASGIAGETAEGWLQGAAAELGRGRVAVFGEAAMFTTQYSARRNKAIGLHGDSAKQNEQFLLNVMRWLSHAL